MTAELLRDRILQTLTQNSYTITSLASTLREAITPRFLATLYQLRNESLVRISTSGQSRLDLKVTITTLGRSKVKSEAGRT